MRHKMCVTDRDCVSEEYQTFRGGHVGL